MILRKSEVDSDSLTVTYVQVAIRLGGDYVRNN